MSFQVELATLELKKEEERAASKAKAAIAAFNLDFMVEPDASIQSFAVAVIARHTNVSEKVLAAVNKGVLEPGRKVIIPLRGQRP